MLRCAAAQDAGDRLPTGVGPSGSPPPQHQGALRLPRKWLHKGSDRFQSPRGLQGITAPAAEPFPIRFSNSQTAQMSGSDAPHAARKRRASLFIGGKAITSGHGVLRCVDRLAIDWGNRLGRIPCCRARSSHGALFTSLPKPPDIMTLFGPLAQAPWCCDRRRRPAMRNSMRHFWQLARRNTAFADAFDGAETAV